MSKIRWGILSTAKIAREYVIPAITASELGTVAAIASRREGVAEQTARDFGIAKAYHSYQALLDDPNIDAIYNPLPNDLHVPWSIKALQAGKHVLVEKPAGLDTADLEPLLAAAQRHPELKVMEAFMYRFHPQWQTILSLCEEIGPIHSIQGMFSYNNRDADNIRHNPAMGGGALMDIGGYPISLARLIYGAEPVRVVGLTHKLEDYTVDCVTGALMEFPTGMASFAVSTKSEAGQWTDIRGEKGAIRLSPPFNPLIDGEVVIQLWREDKNEQIIIPAANQYTAMTDAFSRAIVDQQPVPTPLTDARANMRVIDAIFASAETDGWVTIND